MIGQAETIRNWPLPGERREQAEIHVRIALWERGIGRISDETQFRVYSILSFVMPDDAASTDEPVPLAELEREAAWQAAYHEQQERQHAPNAVTDTVRHPIKIEKNSTASMLTALSGSGVRVASATMPAIASSVGGGGCDRRRRHAG